MDDLTRIAFLESVENLKPRIKALAGRVPSTSRAHEICVCLQQGRLFFESARQSDLAIRPLILFYGTLAFAKALTAAHNFRSIAAIPQSHGIKDVSALVARVMDLEVCVASDGLFQAFNDAVAPLNRYEYIDWTNMTQSFVLPARPPLLSWKTFGTRCETF